MGHMGYFEDEVKLGLGYNQLQRYIPIKLNEEKIEEQKRMKEEHGGTI